MTYLVINAITGILCDCLTLMSTSIYWWCSYPGNNGRHGDWITGRVHEAQSCARAPFFPFFSLLSRHRSHNLQLQTSPPAGEHSAQSEWNFICDMSWHFDWYSFNIYLFDIGYYLKLKYNFTQTSTCACLFTLPCVTLLDKKYK